MLLTEVLKERDAQISMKNGKLDSEKIREAHLLRLQQRVSRNTYKVICLLENYLLTAMPGCTRVPLEKVFDEFSF